ncbi:hypothetical protein ACOME3_005731 [Neoechinorhynchus agilis]
MHSSMRHVDSEKLTESTGELLASNVDSSSPCGAEMQGCTVPLSEIIDLVIKRVYHEIYVMVDLLDHKKGMERRAYLIEFASTCYNLLYRLYAVVRWSRKRYLAYNITKFIDHLMHQTEEVKRTADMLYYLYHDDLPVAMLPELDVALAYNHLNSSNPKVFSTIPDDVVQELAPGLHEDTNRKLNPNLINAYLQYMLHKAWSCSPAAAADERDDTHSFYAPPIESCGVRSTIRNGRLTLRCEHYYETTLTLNPRAFFSAPLRVLDVKFLVDHRGMCTQPPPPPSPNTQSHIERRHFLLCSTDGRNEKSFGDQILSPRDTLGLIRNMQCALDRFNGSLFILHSELMAIATRLKFNFLKQEWNRFVQTEGILASGDDVRQVESSQSCLQIEYWRGGNDNNNNNGPFSISFLYEDWHKGSRLTIRHKPPFSELRTLRIAEVYDCIHRGSIKSALDRTIYYRSVDVLGRLHRVLKDSGIAATELIVGHQYQSPHLSIQIIPNLKFACHRVHIAQYSGSLVVTEDGDGCHSEQLVQKYKHVLARLDPKSAEQLITYFRLHYAHRIVSELMKALPFMRQLVSKESIIDSQPSSQFDPLIARIFNHNQSLLVITMPTQLSSQIRFGFIQDPTETKHSSGGVVWLNNDTVVRASLPLTVPSVSDLVENPEKFMSNIVYTITHLRKILPLLIVYRANPGPNAIQPKIFYQDRDFYLNIPTTDSTPNLSEYEHLKVHFANDHIVSCRLYFQLDLRTPVWRLEFLSKLSGNKKCTNITDDDLEEVTEHTDTIKMVQETEYRANYNPLEHWLTTRRLALGTLSCLGDIVPLLKDQFISTEQSPNPCLISQLTVGRFSVKYKDMKLDISCDTHSFTLQVRGHNTHMALLKTIGRAISHRHQTHGILSKLSWIRQMSLVIESLDSMGVKVADVANTIEAPASLELLSIWNIRVHDDDRIEFQFVPVKTSMFVQRLPESEHLIQLDISALRTMFDTLQPTEARLYEQFRQILYSFSSSSSDDLIKLTYEQFSRLISNNDGQCPISNLMMTFYMMVHLNRYLLSPSSPNCLLHNNGNGEIDGNCVYKSTQTLIAFSFSLRLKDFGLKLTIHPELSDERVVSAYSPVFSHLEQFFERHVTNQSLRPNALVAFLKLLVDSDPHCLMDVVRLEQLSNERINESSSSSVSPMQRLGFRVKVELVNKLGSGSYRLEYPSVKVEQDVTYIGLSVRDMVRNLPGFTIIIAYHSRTRHMTCHASQFDQNISATMKNEIISCLLSINQPGPRQGLLRSLTEFLNRYRNNSLTNMQQ